MARREKKTRVQRRHYEIYVRRKTRAYNSLQMDFFFFEKPFFDFHLSIYLLFSLCWQIKYYICVYYLRCLSTLHFIWEEFLSILRESIYISSSSHGVWHIWDFLSNPIFNTCKKNVFFSFICTMSSYTNDMSRILTYFFLIFFVQISTYLKWSFCHIYVMWKCIFSTSQVFTHLSFKRFINYRYNRAI